MRAATLLLGLVLVSCGSDGDSSDTTPLPPGTIELTNSGACADAFFWAESESGEIAVTVYVEAFARSAEGPTTISLALPDPDIDVEILTGRDLSLNFCTDLPDSGSNPVTRVTPVAGTGEIMLDALLPLTEACGSTTGTLRLEGLMTGNGATFAPIEIESNMIGCYAG